MLGAPEKGPAADATGPSRLLSYKAAREEAASRFSVMARVRGTTEADEFEAGATPD
jgi:hypothetical protein